MPPARLFISEYQFNRSMASAAPEYLPLPSQMPATPERYYIRDYAPMLGRVARHAGRLDID